MRKLSAFILLTLFCQTIAAAEDATKPEIIQCETKINFVADYDKAFELAKAENKPLFIVQLSGNLKNSEFT